MGGSTENLIKNILRDIEIELRDEFDRNFEREAFFSEGWQRRQSPVRGDGHLLVDTGSLRRSLGSEQSGSSVVFRSEHPAASIHNEGGEIRVTERMKRYFWHKYYESLGSFGRRKDGTLRKDKRNSHLSEVADFYRAMALKKTGSTVKIPKRQFLGASPEVEKTVREIIEENIEEYIRGEFPDKTIMI